MNSTLVDSVAVVAEDARRAVEEAGTSSGATVAYALHKLLVYCEALEALVRGLPQSVQLLPPLAPAPGVAEDMEGA